MDHVIGVHETAARVLEEESHREHLPMLESMWALVACVDKLKADRLYLARSVMNYDEIVTGNRDYYKKQVAEFDKTITTLENRVADTGLDVGKLPQELDRVEKQSQISSQVEWISTAGRLPPTKGRYLIVWSKTAYLARWDGMEWRFESNAVIGVTHWAELPAVPQESKEQDASN